MLSGAITGPQGRIGQGGYFWRPAEVPHGPFCSRLHEALSGSAIEVYFDDGEKKLKTARRDGTMRTVCGYRLAVSREALEFFIEADDGAQILSVDDACEKAVGDFIFPAEG